MSDTKKVSIKKLYIVFFLLSFIFYNTQINIPSIFQTVLTAACLGLFVCYLFKSKYSIQILTIYMCVLLIGLTSYVITGMSVFLLMLLGIIMFNVDDVEDIAKILFLMRIIAFVIMIVGYFGGFISNEKVSIYKSGLYITKYTMGFNHPNQLGQALGIIILLFICLTSYKKSAANKMVSLILILIAYAISGSRTMAIICVTFCLFSILIQNKQRNEKICILLIKYRWICMALILFFGIGMPMLMTRLTGKMLTYLYAFNGLLGSRFSYAAAVMDNYDLTLFGNVFDFSYLKTLYGNYAVDNSYINLLYGFGIIALAVLVFFSMYAVKYLAGNEKVIYAFLILILCLWGCFENILFIPTINIGVLFLGVGIENSTIRKKLRHKHKIRLK